ncbi:MAG: hypothetical protein FIB01_14050 [Gemmatimonadetes bacterium]|nr:hypothetical protein [Gemmatimonadota bacterium]
MEQRDFILREIERIGVLLAAVRRRIVGKQTSHQEVRQDLLGAAARLGVDLDTAQQVSAETLAMMLTAGGSLEPTRCWFLAESLYLEGLAALPAATTDQGEDLLLRARMLFELLDRGNIRLAGVTEARERIEEIDTLLRGGPQAA